MEKDDDSWGTKTILYYVCLYTYVCLSGNVFAELLLPRQERRSQCQSGILHAALLLLLLLLVFRGKIVFLKTIKKGRWALIWSDRPLFESYLVSTRSRLPCQNGRRPTSLRYLCCYCSMSFTEKKNILFAPRNKGTLHKTGRGEVRYLLLDQFFLRTISRNGRTNQML